MRQTLEFIVNEEWDGKSLLSYIEGQGFSKRNRIAFSKVENAVLVNGYPRRMKESVWAKDRITIAVLEENSSENIVPVYYPLDLVYEDDDILVINKAANMPIHPSQNHYENTLANGVAYYFKEKGEPFVFRCINRLDRDTTGLTVLAKHAYAAAVLNEQMVKRKIHREYTALVEGIVEEAEGRIAAPIGRAEGSTIERKIDWDAGEEAVTDFKVLQRGKQHSLLQLCLQTGRTHQIRVHMQAMGHPLVGDFLYNPHNKEMNRQALHAGKLNFVHPITKKELCFTVELPEDIRQLLEGNLF